MQIFQPPSENQERMLSSVNLPNSGAQYNIQQVLDNDSDTDVISGLTIETGQEKWSISLIDLKLSDCH